VWGTVQLLKVGIQSSAAAHGMLYKVKSEQVSLSKRIARSSVVFASTFFVALIVHHLWFPQTAFGIGEKLFDSIVAAGAFLCSIRNAENTRLK